MNRSEASITTKDPSRVKRLSIILAIAFALGLFFAPNLIRLWPLATR
jgi:hypothetical protein